MFAVIETGGKQYRVQAGDVLDVELLPVEPAKKGERETIVFDRVLLVYGEGGTRVGNPVIPGARVAWGIAIASSGPCVPPSLESSGRRRRQSGCNCGNKGR